MEVFLQKLISDSTDVLSLIRKRVYVKTDAKKDYKNEPLKKLALEFATTHGISAILGIIYMLDVFKMVLSKKISKEESKKFYIKIFLTYIEPWCHWRKNKVYIYFLIMTKSLNKFMFRG